MAEQKINQEEIKEKAVLKPEQEPALEVEKADKLLEKEKIEVPEAEAVSEIGIKEEGVIQKITGAIGDLVTEEEEEITPEEEETKEKVEDILEEDLKDVYQKMPEEKKEEFREEGEQIASRIVVLLRRVKVKTTKIYYLIKRWLKIVPGINRFFLSQEAKIKTDKIIEMEMKERKEEKSG